LIYTQLKIKKQSLKKMEGLIKGLADVAFGGRRPDDENTKEEENTVEQQSRSSWAQVSMI
jgi:hypothetical protein